jgi:hypothetical protein
MSDAKKLVGRVVRVGAVGENLKREMYALFEKYYQDISYAMFVSDLSEKTHVILIRDELREGKPVIGVHPENWRVFPKSFMTG